MFPLIFCMVSLIFLHVSPNVLQVSRRFFNIIFLLFPLNRKRNLNKLFFITTPQQPNISLKFFSGIYLTRPSRAISNFAVVDGCVFGP